VIDAFHATLAESRWGLFSMHFTPHSPRAGGDCSITGPTVDAIPSVSSSAVGADRDRP
jgi:hypothetical protein